MSTLTPKEIGENIRFRGTLLLDCDSDPNKAAMVLEMCRRDILFWVNMFCWTYDPRLQGGKEVPFITYTYQDEVITKTNDLVANGGHIFEDKSRDMGATWMKLYVFMYRFLFFKGEQFRIGSSKEDFVDTPGVMDTHFEKFRFMLDRFPRWMLPIGWDRKKHCNYMRILNPENGNALIGEATNANFGRGGRPKAILYDEFQSWDVANEAWVSGSDATKCKIALGTPKGMGNKFAELARTDEVKNKIHLMWYRHPKKCFTSKEYLDKVKTTGVFVKGKLVHYGKDQTPAPKDFADWEKPLMGEGAYVDQNGKIRSEWYDVECSNRTDDDIAENLDCNYLTTGNPYFDTDKVEARRLVCQPPKWVGSLNWKVKPVFDSEGYCVNMGKFEVEFFENENGLIKIWEKPVLNNENSYWEDGYALSSDIAEGLEQSDNNSGSVLRRFPLDGEMSTFRYPVVATIHGKITPIEYAEEMVKLAVYYGYAWIAPEKNNHGLAVINQALNIYNKFYWKDVMTKGFPEKKEGNIGFSTTKQSKPIICANLSKMISEDRFVDNDEGFWGECLTFVNDNGKLEAQGKSRGERCYDDRVMDRAILLWVNDNLPTPVRRWKQPPVEQWRQELINKRNQGSLVRFTV